MDPPFFAFLSSYQSLFKSFLTSGIFRNLTKISKLSKLTFATGGYTMTSLEDYA